MMVMSLDTSITLFVKDELETDQSIVLSVESNSSVECVKQKLFTVLNESSKISNNISNLVLTFEGKILQNSDRLSDCNINNNSKIHYSQSTLLDVCRGCDERTIKRGIWGTEKEEETWIKAAHENLVNSGIMNPLLAPTDTVKFQPSMIPKIIHQIWLGSPKPTTTQYMKWFESWKVHHPEWEICWWHDKDVQDMINKNEFKNVEAFNNAQNYGEKSDILRYEIMYKYGGLYVDTDMECIQSFNPLHDRCCCSFYAGWSNTGNIELNNGIFGAIPRHPILKDMIQSIYVNNIDRATTTNDIDEVAKEVEQELKMSQVNSLLSSFLGMDSNNFVEATTQPKDNKWNKLMKTIEDTGPGLFTRHVLRYISSSGSRSSNNSNCNSSESSGETKAGTTDGTTDEKTVQVIQEEPVIVLPMAVLYPVPNNVGVVTKKLRNKYIVPGTTLAIHHWAKSWQ
jgi:mannosyltransferase OCH1-like enzyme